MPYSVRKTGRKFQVVKDDDGKVMGTHSSRAGAKRQIRAIHANEGK